MKRAALTTIMVLTAGAVFAGVSNAPSFYQSGYVLVPSSSTNSGTTGLAVSTAYACFKVDDIDALSEGAANATTGLYSVIVYAMTKEFYDSIQAVASSNRITKVTISESVQAASATTLTVIHKVKSDLTITGSDVDSE